MGRRLRASDQTMRLRADRPAPVITVPREVWATALRLAGENRRRLVVRPGGAVLVRDRPA